MRSLRRHPFVAVIPLASLLVACGGDDEDASPTTTEAAASGDLSGESITLYSGRDEELIAPLIEQFTEETGIEVDARYGESAEMGAQLLEEGDATPADVFYSQEVGAVGVLAEAGLLAELPEEVVDRVDERFQPGDDNQWVGVTGRSRVIVYNPDLIEAPEGVEELTDEAYRGKVAIVADNAGFQAFVTGFRESQGEEAARQWLEGLIANDPITDIESNGDVLEAVENGDVPIGLINHYYWARDERQPDLTSQLVFPDGDDPGGLVNATAVAITKGSAEDPAALALVEYLISEEGQTYFVEETFEYPVVDGIDDPEGIPALDDLEGPELDLTDLESLEETQALLNELGLLS
jgi:iron(III) transport system substrate-binding protein